MPSFEPGHKPYPKTGAVKIVRDYLAAHPFMQEITSKDALKALREGGMPEATGADATNVMTSLRGTKTILKTGRYGPRRMVIYRINRDGSSDPTTAPDEKEEPPADAAAADEPTQKTTDIIEDKTSMMSLEKTIKELEEQLLVEMQKNEDKSLDLLNLKEAHAEEINALKEEHSIEVGALRQAVERLEKGLDMDFHTFGKSVFKAHQDLLQRFNQLEASNRNEIAKLTKMRSDDRQMIGGLQKKIRSLETDNRSMRMRLHSNVTSDRPDVSIFNPPKFSKGGPNS